MEITAAKSDRVMVILSAAMLDDVLQDVLISRLRETTLTDRAFGPTGFLGGTAAKVDLAYLMYAVNKTEMRALHGITKIRNIFAHDMAAQFDSQTKKMNEAFDELQMHTEKSTYIGPFGRDTEFPVGIVDNRRRQFEVNVQLLLMSIPDDLYHRHYPHTSIPFDVMAELVRTRGMP